jgi:hypothetical protein
VAVITGIFAVFVLVPTRHVPASRYGIKNSFFGEMNPTGAHDKEFDAITVSHSGLWRDRHVGTATSIKPTRFEIEPSAIVITAVLFLSSVATP